MPLDRIYAADTHQPRHPSAAPRINRDTHPPRHPTAARGYVASRSPASILIGSRFSAGVNGQENRASYTHDGW